MDQIQNKQYDSKYQSGIANSQIHTLSVKNLSENTTENELYEI